MKLIFLKRMKEKSGFRESVTDVSEIRIQVRSGSFCYILCWHQESSHCWYQEHVKNLLPRSARRSVTFCDLRSIKTFPKWISDVCRRLLDIRGCSILNLPSLSSYVRGAESRWADTWCSGQPQPCGFSGLYKLPAYPEKRGWGLFYFFKLTLNAILL